MHFMRWSHLLATAADSSGVVRLWDVRMLGNAVAGLFPSDATADDDPPHLNAVPLGACLNTSDSKGVVTIAEDPGGANELQRDGIYGCLLALQGLATCICSFACT